MKRIVLIVLGVLAVSISTFAQTPAEAIEKALAPAPRNAREGAAVIKWKADNTYDTLKQAPTDWPAMTGPGSPDSSRSPCDARA